jgi:hypothetical protein
LNCPPRIFTVIHDIPTLAAESVNMRNGANMDSLSERREGGGNATLKFLSAANALALILTILFWAAVFMKRLVPLPGGISGLPERANAATTYGFMVGDILWSVPLLMFAALGLRRRKFWGWTAAQMANILWIYSMTVIWIRDGNTSVSPGAVLFTPFALLALWSIGYLWKHRHLFSE